MKKEGFSRFKAAMKGKGFIFALLLSVTAVGAATFIAYNSVMNDLTDGGETENSSFQEELAVDKEQSGVPKEEAQITDVSSEDEAANNFFTAKAPRIMPVEGEIINSFSNGELVKSDTLNLWQTHDGIDIAAENGTEVKSCTTGTVKEVYQDPLWGYCVTIDHGDGVLGIYCGLDKSVSVIAGQTVQSGEVIGKTGNTADCESALAPHLHFEVKENGKYVNPEEFIGG